jgi:phosphatidylcholine synthase
MHARLERTLNDPDRRDQAAAFSVHILTASGAFLALLAALAAIQGHWVAFWLWLGLCLVVDGIDGPIARKLNVGERLPDWSGDYIDMVVDYVTYVFLPALALYLAGIVPGTLGIIAAGLIVVSSALYYADTRMKLSDNQFRGFPVVWNMVVFVLAALQPSDWVAFAVIVGCAILTFVPMPFVHPVRVRRWRPLTLAVTVAWGLAAAAVLAYGMTPPDWLMIALAGASIYLFLIGAVLYLTDPTAPIEPSGRDAD